MAQTQHAKLSPRYWIKQVIIIVVVAGLGVWGFLDGFIIYPNQAVKFAEWTEWEYLDFLRNPPAGAAPGANLGVASIPDPSDAYERLDAPSYNRSPEGLDDFRGNWLDSLLIAGRLDAQYTTYPRENSDEGAIGSAFERHQQLQEVWSEVDRANAPKRRSRFDIMAQYPIFLIGAGLALYFLYGLLRAASMKYAWDPDAKRITLPGGLQVVPDQVAEFDKSQWHKFYVNLVLNDSHSSHAGQVVKVDLYRHVGPEDWILEMERERFPEQAEAEATPGNDAGGEVSDESSDASNTDGSSG